MPYFGIVLQSFEVIVYKFSYLVKKEYISSTGELLCYSLWHFPLHLLCREGTYSLTLRENNLFPSYNLRENLFSNIPKIISPNIESSTQVMVPLSPEIVIFNL